MTEEDKHNPTAWGLRQIKLGRIENVSRVPASISLCFLTADALCSVASHFCDRAAFANCFGTVTRNLTSALSFVPKVEHSEGSGL